MAELFQHGDFYYAGYVGPFHIRVPNLPSFWLWAAEGGADHPDYDKHKFAVRVLWRHVPHFQDFCLERFYETTVK